MSHFFIYPPSLSSSLNLSDGQACHFGNKIFLKFWKLGKVFLLFSRALVKKKNLSKSTWVKVTDSKYANYETLIKVVISRIKLYCPSNEILPSGRAGGFAFSYWCISFKVPCARAGVHLENINKKKQTSSSPDGRTFDICPWYDYQMSDS